MKVKPHIPHIFCRIKNFTKEALLKEQGYICCYCGRQVNLNNSHIEHLKSRELYPVLALDYHNFLASFPGEKEENSKTSVHCGHNKKDKDLKISPLHINCANFFRYTETGQILNSLPLDKAQKEAAQDTIKTLGLNIDKLKGMRKAAIEDILDNLDIENQEEIQLLIEGFNQLDLEGKYSEFCFVVLYILQRYLTP